MQCVDEKWFTHRFKLLYFDSISFVFWFCRMDCVRVRVCVLAMNLYGCDVRYSPSIKSAIECASDYTIESYYSIANVQQ